MCREDKFQGQMNEALVRPLCAPDIACFDDCCLLWLTCFALQSCGVIFFAMMSGEFPFENAALILKGLYKSPKHFPVLAKESLIKRIFVVDPAKRIQSVEEIQATQWMQQFNAQRNTFGMYRDVLLQIRDLRSKKAPIKIGGVLQCRFQFLRIMLMVKVVKALKEPSIKGAPRDVKAVIQDRLYSALHMLQNCVKALPANQSTCVNSCVCVRCTCKSAHVHSVCVYVYSIVVKFVRAHTIRAKLS
jgi:serine/threonine protein kinase